MARQKIILLSLGFIAALAAAISACFAVDGLVWFLEPDGTVVYFRDSGGSIVNRDENLLFVICYLAPLLVRAVRLGRRPGLLEIGLFALASMAVFAAFTAAGFTNMALTVAHSGQPWMLVSLLAIAVATLLFIVLAMTDRGAGKAETNRST